jgi:transcriptional regulator with XRE-family HTH domain
MIAVGQLTRGERLRIWRRRNEITQEKYAENHGVPTKHVAEWEDGKRDGVPNVPSLAKLTPGEACYIARNRAGYTVKRAAKLMKVSRITLLKMEADRTSTTGDLVAFWVARNWGTDKE